MVFITDNEASLHAVNTAVALARPDIDSVHVMHACTSDGSTADAQKLMARLTPGLGSRISSEVMVHPLPDLANAEERKEKRRKEKKRKEVNADCCVGLLLGLHDHLITMCLFTHHQAACLCLPACLSDACQLRHLFSRLKFGLHMPL